jgi:serine/threonine-protein kinase
VWGLGAVLYELLTGWPPYHAETPAAALARVLGTAAAPVRVIVPLVVPALAAVAERALSHDPADRFASARQFAAELDPFLPAPPKHGGPRVVRFPEAPRRELPAGVGRFSLMVA